MKHNEIEVKCRMTSQSLADLFENIAKSVREGRIVLQKESSFVTLTPCGDIDLEMEASAKKGKFKFEIQLKWREDMASAETEEPAFTISCEEPCMESEGAERQEAGEVSEDILYRKF